MQRLFGKVVSMLLAFCLVLGITPALAEGLVLFGADNEVVVSATARSADGASVTEVRPGATVFVDVSLDETPGLYTLGVHTTWNAALATVLSSTGSSEAMSNPGSPNATNPGSVRWLFINMDDDMEAYDRTDTGHLVTFEFQIADSAPIGSVITFTLEADGPAGNFDGDQFIPSFTNATVTVVDAPAPVITITTQPASATVTEGSISGSLSVVATVTEGATLTYQWYQNGTPVVGATSASFAIPNGLTVGNHEFHVVVSAEGATSVTSATAVVTVEERGILWGAVLGRDFVDSNDFIMFLQFVLGHVDSLPNEEAGNWHGRGTVHTYIFELGEFLQYLNGHRSSIF